MSGTSSQSYHPQYESLHTEHLVMQRHVKSISGCDELNAPCKRASAACSGFWPSSDSSILSVILGLVLFSSMYPGLKIVPGKNIWMLMEYSRSSERRVSARPGQRLTNVNDCLIVLHLLVHVSRVNMTSSRSKTYSLRLTKRK
jgi:hypothetical protein